MSPVVGGCFTHRCDASSYDYNGGRIIGGNTYETTDFNGPWLDYPGNVTIRVHFPMDVGDAAVIALPPVGYVGVSQDPNEESGSTYVAAAGQLAQYTHLNSEGFTVTNATCAHYFAFFLVQFEPLDAGFGAGTD
jgi:hypothetical protein